MTKICKLSIVLSGILLAESNMASNIESKTLETISTHSHKGDAKNHDYANTSTLNAESIKERQATDLKEAFAQDASVSVGGASINTQKLYIRGMEDRLFNVSLDSANQYGNIFHHQGNVFIDTFMIKSIQIHKGIGDYTLGSLGLAGSLNIRTKDARDFLRNNEKYGATIGAAGYTNQGYRANLAGYFATKNTDALLYLNQTNILGFYAGSNDMFKVGSWVKGSASDNKSILFKLNQNLGEKDTLSLTYSGINEQTTAPFGKNLINGLSLYSHDNYNHTATIGYTHKGENLKIQTNAYYNNRSLLMKELEQTTGAHEETSSKNIAFNNYGYNLILSHDFDSVFSSLKYGFNYQGVYVSDSYTKKDGINRGNESGNIYGGFVGTTLSFLDALSLDLSTRYDVFTYFDKNAQSHLTQGFSPAAAINYYPLDSLSFRFGYGMVTRGALPGDATLLGDNEAKVAKHLKAQTAHNFELDADYNIEHFIFRAAGYYSIINNFINSYVHDADHDMQGGGGAHNHGVLRKNQKDAIEVAGYEIGAGFNIGGFDSYLSIAQSFPMYRGYLLQDTYELGATSGVGYNLNLSYHFESIDLKISWLSQFKQRVSYKGYDIYNDEVFNIDKKGYGIHSIYINYSPLKSGLVDLGLAVNNIFNTFYIAQTSPFKNEAMESASVAVRSAMPNPGIDARFEVRVRF